MVEVRSEHSADSVAIRRVHEAAFEQPDEADIVDRLRERAAEYLGLVAIDGGEIVGHIAFSPITLDPPPLGLSALGLAPMAVLPRRQRMGIGSALIRDGLTACRHTGGDAVFVLGHPAYYPRFGFAPAAERGVRSEYDVPPEAFMVLELTPGVLDDVRGIARYDPALAG